MTPPLPDLEVPPRQTGLVPFLWLAVAMLVMAAIAALIAGIGRA